MSTRNNRIGGGVVNEFNALSSTKFVKNSQKNIFKPLVATSLALTLGVSIGNANWLGTDGNSNYWNGSSMQNQSNKPASFPPSGNYAYTSYGSFFGNGSDGSLTLVTSTSNPQNIEIDSSGMQITVALWANSNRNTLITDRGTITIDMKNSYLKFEDGGQPNDHFLGARNQGGNIQATFAGGSGSETINGITYNNLAFYGGIILETTNNGKSNFNFSSGASVLGMLKAKNSNNANDGAGFVNADYTFSGGGNIFAITKDSYTGWGEANNIKDKAIVIDTGIGNTTKTTTTINITFGENGKKEYVTDTSLLDDDGVITKKLTDPSTQVISQVATNDATGKTLITNAIKGNITVNGYNNVESVLNLKFFNNGLIEGLITTSSVAKVNIYFANKGTIRGDLSFSSGGDGTTGTLTIAKSESVAKVDDLTIEGNINNQGLDNYEVTAGKFLMIGSAKTGGGNKLTFTTDNATFRNFALENNGTTEITSANSLAISSTNDINTAGTLTITNSGNGTDSSINVKGVYGLGMASADSNSIITTKGSFNAGILAAIKDDGSGDGKIKTTLNIDNTNNDGKIVLSVLDSTSTAENLVFRGGKLNGATLNTNARLNDGAIVAGTATSLNERGNIVLFNNMTGGKAEANFTAGTSSSISVVGDIYTVQGNNNLKLVDTDRNGTTLPEFIGNVTVNNGKANLIFDGTIWAPSNVLELLPSSFSSSSETQVLLAYIKEYGTGKISTTNGGTANIVLRQGANSAFTQQAVFSIDTKGSSQSNILMQKHAGVALNIAASIDYDNQATTRVIFAGSNTGTSSEAFGGTTSFTNAGTSGVQMLGVAYQDGVMFEMGAKTDAQRELIQRYKQVYSGPLLTLGADLNGTTADLSIKGLFMGDAVALASSTKRTGATYNITIRTNAVVAGNIQNQSTDQLNVVMKAGSKIFLDPTVSSGYGTTNEFVTLDFQGATHDFNQDLIDSIRTTNTVIDLGTMGVDYGTLATQSFQAYNLLKINSLSGENASFRVRVGDQNGTEKNVGANGSNLTGFADRVIVKATGNSQVLREFLQPIYTDNVNVDNIVYDANTPNKNIAVLTVKNNSNGDALVNLGALDAIEGFDQISSGLKAVKTDENGGNTNQEYTTYYLAQAESKGASQVVSEVSASALNLNYDLYLANINSLNKRMGELRNNDHSQGAWARVFSGAQTTTFAQETKSTYTTIQAGYDYAFGFEGANNYTGLALSYAMSSSSADSLIDINATTQGIDSVKSQAVEVALYNAYVQDGASADNGFANGLYSDTILKFSYIMSDFNLIGQSNNYSTNNYALTFSQEIGYRFLLGESKEWFIDPQAELTVGYLNQTDLKQTLESGAYLDGVQDSILTLRGRVGANFGYKFDRWTESKGFKAQLYLGTYFEGDYISGGDVSLTTTRGIKTALTPLASTSRGVINVGTNFDVKDQHKIYFDFEKSFGGTIVTDYQVNVGYRFAFGENSGYTPLDPNKKSITPLKVSDENAEESEESQEGVENTQEATSEQTSDEAKANSTEKSEAKSEEKAQ